MSGLKSLPVEDILACGTITKADLARFRRVFYEDGIVSSEEAEILFQLSRCNFDGTAWADFFVEAVTDYIVFQAHPQGYVTSENANWLLDRISHGGFVTSKIELDLAVSVLDKARWAPVSLAKFALDQIKLAVVTGAGPLRGDPSAPAGTITAGEVDLLRRILYAFGGDGHVAITREEADVLFDIDEAVARAAPNPAWTDLFVKAVANVIMAISGYAVPSREQALRQVDLGPVERTVGLGMRIVIPQPGGRGQNPQRQGGGAEGSQPPGPAPRRRSRRRAPRRRRGTGRAPPRRRRRRIRRLSPASP